MPEDLPAQSANLPDRRFEDRVREQLAPELHITRVLGKSPVAEVYLAREPALKRLVAVKILAPGLASDESAVRRFEREAQSAARITHPNVVTVYRVGRLGDGLPYLVMRYVKGRSLAALLRAQGPLPAARACTILRDVASAVAAAHDKRVVHRDIKPANILIEDATGNVLVFDFGIAAILVSGDEEPDRITTVGRVIGDPQYMSPERLHGEPVDERADVYNLGLLGYELLSRESPFEAASNSDWMELHLNAEPRRLSELRDRGSASLADLLRRCLAKEPDHRPNAADVAEAVAELQARPATGAKAADPPSEVPTMSPAPPGLLAPHGHEFRLDVLGSLELVDSDGARVLSIVAQSKRVALLTYLAVGSAKRFKRRDTIVGVFWPDFQDEKARHALRQAVYVLRRSLGSETVVSRGDDDLGLAPEALWCDAVAFERALDDNRPDCAMQLYKGQLLPGFHLPASVEFEHWLDEERARFERLAAEAAWQLSADREAAGDGSGALHWARRAGEILPFDESVIRRLLELHARSGDRAGAFNAYENFSRRLRSEFETEPARETQELVDRIRGQA